jgi:hypothetical protein
MLSTWLRFQNGSRNEFANRTNAYKIGLLYALKMSDIEES